MLPRPRSRSRRRRRTRATPRIPENPRPTRSRSAGLGDVTIFDLLILPQSWGRLGVGVVGSFAAATSDVSAHASFGPAIGAVIPVSKKLNLDLFNRRVLELTDAGAVMHDPCMATKTISLELDAYERLRKAKRSERESFSEVVRRARWDDAASTGPQILARLSELRLRHSDSFLPDDVLDRIGERARTRPARAVVATAKQSRAR